MTEADRVTDEELKWSFLLVLLMQFGLCVSAFVLWATFQPMVALSFTIVLYVLLGVAIRMKIALSNMLYHSRSLAYQEAMMCMIHANLLRYEEDQYRNADDSIREAMQQTERLWSQMNDSSIKVKQMFETEDSASIGQFLAGHLFSFSCLLAAAGLGIYFAPNLESIVETAHLWVVALR